MAMSPSPTEPIEISREIPSGKKKLTGRGSKNPVATEGQRSPRHIRAIPATWFSPDALWNTEILPAFREKIDFSSIQLRHNPIPSNHVELAKVEYWEVQRQFEEQLSKINLTSQDATDEGDYSMVGQGAKRILSKGHCGPFFSEKIDLNQEISRLRPTPPQVKPSNSNSDDTFINPTFVTIRNSLHHVTPSPRPDLDDRNDQTTPTLGHYEDRDSALSPHAENSNTIDYPDVQMESPDDGKDRELSPSANLAFEEQFESSRNNDFSGKIFDIFSQQHPSDFFTIPTPTALLWRAELERKEPTTPTLSLSSWFNSGESQRFQLS